MAIQPEISGAMIGSATTVLTGVVGWVGRWTYLAIAGKNNGNGHHKEFCEGHMQLVVDVAEIKRDVKWMRHNHDNHVVGVDDSFDDSLDDSDRIPVPSGYDSHG